jgi:hypothetical protein
MCDSAPVLKNVSGQAKEMFSTKRLQQAGLSGGLSTAAQISDNGKDLDSIGRKEAIEGARERDIIPQKKVSVDPEEERRRASAAATTQANARIAFQRKAQRDNSLLTGGGSAGRTSLGV